MIDLQATTHTGIRLTALSHGAGCACKLGSAELAEVLRHLPGVSDPRVLVDASSRDDAAVFLLTPDRALIATTDFFTPIVDDARSWGAIAAANALSDVYAMGGTPLFALNLVAWPRTGLPFELLGEVLAGAAEVAQEAGCLLLGGHSIDDAEPKFGLAVTGEAHPDHLMTNAAGKAGDYLVLTKPLGTGLLTTALKRDRLTESDLAGRGARHAHPQRRGRPRRPARRSPRRHRHHRLRPPRPPRQHPPKQQRSPRNSGWTMCPYSGTHARWRRKGCSRAARRATSRRRSRSRVSTTA